MLCTFHSCGFGSCPSLGMCRAQAGVCSPSCFRTRRPQSEALESPWDFCRRQPSSSHGRISVQGLECPKSQGWAPAGGQPLGNAPSRAATGSQGPKEGCLSVLPAKGRGRKGTSLGLPKTAQDPGGKMGLGSLWFGFQPCWLTLGKALLSVPRFSHLWAGPTGATAERFGVSS